LTSALRRQFGHRPTLSFPWTFPRSTSNRRLRFFAAAGPHLRRIREQVANRDRVTRKLGADVRRLEDPSWFDNKLRKGLGMPAAKREGTSRRRTFYGTYAIVRAFGAR
jgi:hypothetical protein